MKPRRLTMLMVAIASAAMPLVTTATCNPATGSMNFFRDDDNEYWEDDFYYNEEVIYYDDPYYYEDVYYDDIYYDFCDFCF